MELQSFPPDAIAEWGVRPCEGACATQWAAHNARQRAQASEADSQLGPLLLNVSGAQQSPVNEMLFGMNLELVRHSMFAGLSAQLVANRLFGSKTGLWPPPRWQPIGAPALREPGLSRRSGTFAVACALRRYGDECGVQQTQVDQGFSPGPNNGSAIAVEANRCYSARLVLRTAPGGSGIRLRATLSDDGGAAVLASWSGNLRRPAWQTFRFNFTAKSSSRSATLRLWGACQPPDLVNRVAAFGGLRPESPCNTTFWIGAVSLMPCDHVHGARADVLRLLAELNFRGPLRWPGGCFSSISPHWRDSLLPPDERPPVHNPPGPFCDAVKDGQFAYTDGISENWPGVDEYFALARIIGATPAIGLKLNFGTVEEVQDAAEFLEYCNGGNHTRPGRERIARGHPEPHGVRIVYLGNEIGAQYRFTSRACAVPAELRGLTDVTRRANPLFCRGAPRAGISCGTAYSSNPDRSVFRRCEGTATNCTLARQLFTCAPPPERVDGGVCRPTKTSDPYRPHANSVICPPVTPREYRDMLPRLKAALSRVDPTIRMIASNASPNLTSYDGTLKFDWACAAAFRTVGIGYLLSLSDRHCAGPARWRRGSNDRGATCTTIRLRKAFGPTATTST